MRFNTGKLIIEKIPLRFSWFHHPLDSNLIISDSASSIRDKEGISHQFFGHAAGYVLQEVIHRSCYEVLERILAFGPSYSDIELHKGFVARPVIDDLLVEEKILPSEAILVRTKNKESTASGLGIHTDRVLAIEHAVYELIERDLLCRLWYLDYQVCKIKNELLKDGYYIEYYTVIDTFIPFVLAVVKSTNNPIMYCGSCCSSNWDLSLEKARAEALLLVADALCRKRDSIIGNRLDTINRLNTLYGEMAEKQEEHLANKLRHSNIVYQFNNTCFKDIVHEYFKNTNYLYIAPLRKWGKFHLVKAICENILTKPKVRLMVENNIIPAVIPDPFC